MSSIGGISGIHLQQLIEQLESLEEQKSSVSDDIREVFSEAKSSGFDVKAMRQILKMRKTNENELREQEMVLETYLQALKMTEKDNVESEKTKEAASYGQVAA